MNENKILYNFFYLVAQDILKDNGKQFTPYELHNIAESMADSEGISDFRSHYEEMVLETLDEIE